MKNDKHAMTEYQKYELRRYLKLPSASEKDLKKAVMWQWIFKPTLLMFFGFGALVLFQIYTDTLKISRNHALLVWLILTLAPSMVLIVVSYSFFYVPKFFKTVLNLFRN